MTTHDDNDWRAAFRASQQRQQATREAATRHLTGSQLDAILLAIAQEHTAFETLATRNSDSLDFHDVSAWGLKAALEAAFAAGQETGQKNAGAHPPRTQAERDRLVRRTQEADRHNAAEAEAERKTQRAIGRASK